ncbi:PREDICTED: uncharacterized protein LOC104810834 isoform X2 [Tarenaya hassleriana]|uniref:uncharacterized protein LOC104810834 isoform X2 n=1 Tax=Tarenaya hassleriana TaxID=28532 RepID=UPI00053C69CE|nr:PREDICTED: uncharacterized protein LOC104810834 isoform X2 [Tarenaya hassleriana]
MSDQGEKTCPLCAEEMDLTDQQLKPCKCGYQICVWCWHQIMDMAEKGESAGRCPACRTQYDKEKIVGMTVNCERVASESNMDRKKMQKSKPKPSEGRKQLASVRVIQKNLVYIVGLLLDLADEDLLQRKEYFGQYGKVLKVSMSRTASGAIQQFPNNTCSVYITYSKEEEAVRCIQSVHGFILDGKSLKACFGTTKYCHAWLRNVPCNNPDCLYLHEIGCQEDSFTKDEVISAHSRVQQITGATYNPLRRSGSVLPPPVDDYCGSSSAANSFVNVPSNVTSKATSPPKSSPPNGSSGRSTALPAAASWGTRVPNQQSVAATITSKGSCDEERTTLENGTLVSAAVVKAAKQPSRKEESQTVVRMSELGTLKSLQHNRANSPDRDLTSNQQSSSVESSYDNRVMNEPSAVVNSMDYTEGIAGDGLSVSNLSTDVARMGITTNFKNDHPHVPAILDIHSDQGSIRQPGNEVSKLPQAEQCRKDPPMRTDEKSVVSRESGWRSGSQPQMQVRSKSEVKDVISFDGRQNVGEVVSHSLPNPNHLAFGASPVGEISGALTLNADSFLGSRGSNTLLSPNGFAEKSMPSVQHSLIGQNRIQNAEDDIISSIYSLDFDPWDESLTSPQDLVKLLGQGDQRASSLKPPNLLQPQQNSQSRFSFARQDEPNLLTSQHYNQALESQRYGIYGQLPRDQPAFQESGVSRNGFASNYSERLETFASASPTFPSYKIPASRSQISAPPGFSAPSRLPPPGFSSHERVDRSSDAVAGTRLHDSTSLLRNTYQSVNPDIEFMDPAILAVGRGRLHSGLESAGFENDPRLQLLMQSHEYGYQDRYGMGSRLMDQTQGTSLSPQLLPNRQPSPNSLLSNGGGVWDNRWNNNEAQGGNSLGMAEELLRRSDQRSGFNSNLYNNGFDESRFRMPGSGDHLYNNRTFGM